MANKNWRTITGETPQAKLAAAAQLLRLEKNKPLEWVRRPVVGIVWDAGDGEFSIVATRVASGPVLCLQRGGFAEGYYPTLKEAQEGAEKSRRTTVLVRATEYPSVARGVVGRKPKAKGVGV